MRNFDERLLFLPIMWIAVLGVAWLAHTQSLNTGSSIQVAQSSAPPPAAACETFSDPLTICNFDHFTSGEELSGTIGNLGWGLGGLVSTVGCVSYDFAANSNTNVFYDDLPATDPVLALPTTHKHPGLLRAQILGSGTQVAGAFVAEYAINNPGINYVPGNVLTFNAGNHNATITVDTVDGAGHITSSHISCFGNGYPNSSVGTALTGGAGTLATADITGTFGNYQSLNLFLPASPTQGIGTAGYQFYPQGSDWTVRFMFLPGDTTGGVNLTSQFALGITTARTIVRPPLQEFPKSTFGPVDFSIPESTYFYIDSFNHTPTGVGTITWHFRNEWDTDLPTDIDTGVVAEDYSASELFWRLFEIRHIGSEQLLHYRIYDEDGTPLIPDGTVPYRPGNPDYKISGPFISVIDVAATGFTGSESGYIIDDYRFRLSSTP